MKIGEATVTLEKKAGQVARLRIVAAAAMIVRRLVEAEPGSMAGRGVLMESDDDDSI